jgi:hypothetical protein
MTKNKMNPSIEERVRFTNIVRRKILVLLRFNGTLVRKYITISITPIGNINYVSVECAN